MILSGRYIDLQAGESARCNELLVQPVAAQDIRQHWIREHPPIAALAFDVIRARSAEP